MFTGSNYPRGRVGRDARRAASSAGRTGLGSRRRTRQRAPAKAWLATVAKPASSARSASSRCAIRSLDGSAGVGGSHAPAVHAAPAHEQRAGLPHEPDAERAALEHEPGAGVQLPRFVADEVAEQPERRRLRRLPRPRARLDDLRAPVRVELGDRPRVDQQDDPDRHGHGVESRASGPPWRASARPGTTADAVQAKPFSRSRSSSMRGRQWTAAISGSPPTREAALTRRRSGGGGSPARRRPAARRPARRAPRRG